VYTSAKYAMALCMFTSVTSQSSVERLNESRLFFAWKLPSAYIVHGIVREFVYLQNKGTSFCNFALNSGLGKFRYGKLIVLSTNTVKLVDFLRSTHVVYYTSVDCHRLLIQWLRFLLDLSHNFFLQLCSSWQDFDWHMRLSAVAELVLEHISLYNVFSRN